jgi:hypothetical protein
MVCEPTTTTCVTDAGSYVLLPAWLAVIAQLPALENVIVLPERVQLPTTL